jgi:hypothetical protein
VFSGHIQRHRNDNEGNFNRFRFFTVQNWIIINLVELLPSVEQTQPKAVDSNANAVVNDLKPPSVSFEDLIFENFEPLHKEMPILCESSNNALDFGTAESAFDAQIAQPQSPSILDELVQAVYGTIS